MTVWRLRDAIHISGSPNRWRSKKLVTLNRLASAIDSHVRFRRKWTAFANEKHSSRNAGHVGMDAAQNSAIPLPAQGAIAPDVVPISRHRADSGDLLGIRSFADMSTNETIIPPRGTKAFAEYRAGVEWKNNRGAEIQGRERGSRAEWRADKYEAGNWDVWDYRVAPAPKYVPWTRETCPELPFEVRQKLGGHRTSVVAVREDELTYILAGTRKVDSVSFDYAIINWTMRDGSPCGTEVVE